MGREAVKKGLDSTNSNNMCLVTTPKRDRSLYRREYYDDAPRPVSNYHGGPQYPHHHHHHHHPRNSATYTRRTSSSVPRERASYRSSYRSSAPRVYDIDRDVDVRRVSRTYVR